MHSLLDLRVVPEGTSHHQTIQQALQLLHEGFKTGCNLERQRKMATKGGRKGSKGRLLLLFVQIFIVVTCHHYKIHQNLI